MFKTGQKVVCVDDQFDPWVYDLFDELPTRNEVYTIRAVDPGRTNPNFEVDGDANLKMTGAEFTALLLLKELTNPNDPHSSVELELGFRSDRFAPLTKAKREERVSKVLEIPDLVPA